MAAEQTVERLRRMMHEDEVDGLAHSLLPRADVRAVLAVVEAAEDLHRELVGADHLDSPQRFHSKVLGSKLAALHTQASDAGKS